MKAYGQVPAASVRPVTFDVHEGDVVVDTPVPPLAASSEIVQAAEHPVFPVLVVLAVQFHSATANGTLGEPAGVSGVHISQILNLSVTKIFFLPTV